MGKNRLRIKAIFLTLFFALPNNHKKFQIFQRKSSFECPQKGGVRIRLIVGRGNRKRPEKIPAVLQGRRRGGVCVRSIFISCISFD